MGDHVRAAGCSLSVHDPCHLKGPIMIKSMSLFGTNGHRRWGRVCPFCPSISDISLFRYRQSVVHFDAEISDRAFDLVWPSRSGTALRVPVRRYTRVAFVRRSGFRTRLGHRRCCCQCPKADSTDARRRVDVRPRVLVCSSWACPHKINEGPHACAQMPVPRIIDCQTGIGRGPVRQKLDKVSGLQITSSQ